MPYKIGSIQLQDIQGDVPRAISIIKASMRKADERRINVLCFPECFLQGYTLDADEIRERALNLQSVKTRAILAQLAGYKAAAILGIIEEEKDKFFNTAVVIRDGKLLGKYRKTHLFEKNFTAGSDYPVFNLDGLKFGINICYDARFSEGAGALAEQGAKVILYPLNNKLPREKAEMYRGKHVPNLIARAKETGCWIVSSDVVHESEDQLAYGCTAIVKPNGEVAEKTPELETAMIMAEI